MLQTDFLKGLLTHFVQDYRGENFGIWKKKCLLLSFNKAGAWRLSHLTPAL